MKNGISTSCIGVQECIQRWGNPLSSALLDPAYEIFQAPLVEGLIGYRQEAGCAVVIGDPVCPEQNRSQLLEAFHRFCADNQLTIIYLGVSKAFAHWSMEQHYTPILLEYGEFHHIDPVIYDNNGTKGRLLRNKCHRAIREGIQAKEYTGQPNILLEVESKKLEKAWQVSRYGPQIYLSHLSLFDLNLDKRWFYAEKEGKIIGLLLLNRVESHKGWLIYHCMALPDAPTGTTEFLITTAYETLRNEDCHYLVLAATAAHRLNEIEGMGMIATWTIRFVYKVANLIFSLDRKSKYWDKFHAEREQSYILFGRPFIGFKEIKGLMRALNVQL